MTVLSLSEITDAAVSGTIPLHMAVALAEPGAFHAAWQGKRASDLDRTVLLAITRPHAPVWSELIDDWTAAFGLRRDEADEAMQLALGNWGEFSAVGTQRARSEERLVGIQNQRHSRESVGYRGWLGLGYLSRVLAGVPLRLSGSWRRTALSVVLNVDLDAERRENWHALIRAAGPPTLDELVQAAARATP